VHKTDRPNPLGDMGPTLYEPFADKELETPQEDLGVWMENYAPKHLS